MASGGADGESLEVVLGLAELRAEIAGWCGLRARASLRSVSRAWRDGLAGRQQWSGLTNAPARLQVTCRNGQQLAAQWLVERFGLTAADARAEDNKALRGVCANGHLAVAQWLAETFSLTAEDARANDNWALRMACENGHLAVAQWLAERFSLTAEDARAEDNDALRWACGAATRAWRGG
jgi:hypothetical protein